jgi:CRISPR-associated protein Cmr2
MEKIIMNTYLALTIGPIYKTINASQRTRMLWGASFLFSYLIRELVKLLKTGELNKVLHPECKIAGKILIPYAEGIESDECIAGEGKYPDRILIHSKEGDFEKVQKAITVLIKYLGKEIAQHTNENGMETQIIKDLTDYLQFYFIEKEVGEKEIALLSLYNDLDVLELRSNYMANDSKNYLFYYLFYISKKNNRKYSLLAEEAFPNIKNKRFRSLIEISTSGYSYSIDNKQNNGAEGKYDKLIGECFIENVNIKKDVPEHLYSFLDKKFEDEDDLQDEFIKRLKTSKEFTIAFKKYHQYFAVIYADGDNIGKTLEEIGNDDEKLKTFSKKLLDFDSEVVTTINNYGGAPVYIGGEDIFAFVPLASVENNRQVTIFNLIKNIDEAFGYHFTKEYADELGVIRPTLSFGIAIAYFRNPLSETMEMARDLLHKAKAKKKNEAENENEKNAIELILEEHSGQQFKMSIQKGKEESYKVICDLMGTLTSKVFAKENEDKQEKSFINSITHKLKDPLFKTLLLSVANDSRRLDEFFKNSFNEPIHRSDMGKEYINKVKDLITAIFTDYCDDKTRINNLYSTLRLIDFMHKNPKDE